MLHKWICKNCYESHGADWKVCAFMGSISGCAILLSPDKLWEMERVIHCPYFDPKGSKNGWFEFSGAKTFSEALEDCSYALEHKMETQKC